MLLEGGEGDGECLCSSAGGTPAASRIRPRLGGWLSHLVAAHSVDPHVRVRKHELDASEPA